MTIFRFLELICSFHFRSLADNKYLDHGRKFEKDGLASLFDTVKPKKVFRSGFNVNPSIPFIGSTTDIIMVDTNDQLCCGEVKCPFTVGSKDRKEKDKDKTVFDMEYLEGDTKETKRLNEKHIYYLQVQLQLLLNKCDYAYFYIYGGGPERENLCLQIWRKDKFI